MVSFSLCPCCQLCEHPELGSLKSEKGAREFALIEDSFPGGECKSRGGGRFCRPLEGVFAPYRIFAWRWVSVTGTWWVEGRGVANHGSHQQRPSPSNKKFSGPRCRRCLRLRLDRTCAGGDSGGGLGQLAALCVGASPDETQTYRQAAWPPVSV